METVYLVCAILGGTLMLCQFLLTLVGIGEHHDLGGDHGAGLGDTHHEIGHHHQPGHDEESAWFVKLLTFRAITAALLFFGLAGLAASARISESALVPLGIAVAAGAAALMAVAWVMQMLAKLQSDGSVRIARAVGAPATVYLTIPAQKNGAGKVHVKVQNRTMEYQAVTSQEQDLPTGAHVVVVAVVNPGMVEVAPEA
ncbi:MAG TPA: hypothetical protein VGY58_19710 [Gemmataceae bacterium]|jgi:hypothetical protein|nr:hypothetical protein [Gemmataceae bacterium]